jgi:hypothetical protein
MTNLIMFVSIWQSHKQIKTLQLKGKETIKQQINVTRIYTRHNHIENELQYVQFLAFQI